MSNKQSSYEKAGASTFKMGVKIFGYAVLAGIVAFMMYMSLTMISNGLFTERIGYYKYDTVDGEKVLLEEVYYDEEHPVGSEKETGDSATRFNEPIIVPRNSLCAAMIVVFDVIEQGLMLAVLFVLCGYYVYVEGDRDRNLVKHHSRAPTPLRGLWIGLIAWVPALVPAAVLILGKCGVIGDAAQGVYNVLTPCFVPLNNLIAPVAQYPTAASLQVWQIALLLLLTASTVAVCAVSYQLGYKRVFKKKKKKAA